MFVFDSKFYNNEHFTFVWCSQKKDKKEKGEKNFKKETKEKKQKERILGGITKRSYWKQEVIFYFDIF